METFKTVPWEAPVLHNSIIGTLLQTSPTFVNFFEMLKSQARNKIFESFKSLKSS